MFACFYFKTDYSFLNVNKMHYHCNVMTNQAKAKIPWHNSIKLVGNEILN